MEERWPQPEVISKQAAGPLRDCHPVSPGWKTTQMATFREPLAAGVAWKGAVNPLAQSAVQALGLSVVVPRFSLRPKNDGC